MIRPMTSGGHTTYNLKEYVVDTPEDLEYLPVEGIAMGSIALVISKSAVYMLNSAGEWVEI